MPQPYANYRPPRIVKTTKRWYVEYWFRVPVDMRNENSKEWERFRVFEDINRYKTDEYANLLLNAVDSALKDGFNPFKYKQKIVEQIKSPQTAWSLNASIDKFLEYCINKGLRKKSVDDYSSTLNMMKAYFLKGNRLYDEITSIREEDIEAFLSDLKKEKNLKNTSYNNHLSYVRTLFFWLVKKKQVNSNPASGIENLPTLITKHKVYTSEIAKKIKHDIFNSNKELYDFIEFTYYFATRPKSETRFLQVKHILFDRELLFVPAHISKNKTDDYIPMSEEMVKLLQHKKNEPGEYYIFGGVKHRSANYFSNKYKPYKDKYGLGDEYTIYGWKHSRAIDLAKAKADPYQIMTLFRHSSLDITMKYLRDLGIVDVSDLHKRAKKF